MKNKRILALAVSMAMMFQVCSPVSAEDMIVEPVVQTEAVQTEAVQESVVPESDPSEGGSMLQEDPADPTEESAALQDDTQSAGEEDLLLDTETELIIEDSFSDVQTDAETGTEPESEPESGSESESDTEPVWDGELSLDLTDTTQMYTVENNLPRAQEHKHEMSVECAGGEGDVEFQPVDSTNAWKSMKNGGNYYLTKDISLVPKDGSLQLASGATLNLCLNGHTVKPSSWQVGYIITINEGATLNLCDCTGTGKIGGAKPNRDAVGGSVWNAGGTFRMYGGTLSDNDAANTSATSNKENARVAGLYSTAGGQSYMYGGKIQNNRGFRCGAGVHILENSVFELRGGTISGNRLFGRQVSGVMGPRGAGVYVEESTFIMTGGSITGNEMTSDKSWGAGVYTDSDSSFTMTGGSITGNTAASQAHGLGVCAGGTFTMSGGTISGHTGGSQSSGGGVYVSGKMVMEGDAVIENNQLSYQGSVNYAQGAGVLVSNGAFVMNGGTIRNNTSQHQGGGVCVFADVKTGSFEMNGGTLEGNTASKYGGAVYVSLKSSFTQNGGTVKNNQAPQGSAVYLMGGTLGTADFIMSGGAMTGNGNENTIGTILAMGESSVTLKNGEISGNTAKQGGALFFSSRSSDDSGLLTIEGGTVTNNTAVSAGGGIYYGGPSDIAISGAPVIMNNTANGAADNFRIGNDKYLALGEMTDGAQISVMTAKQPGGPDDKVVFTRAAAEDYTQYFHSDKAEYFVACDTDNSLYLRSAAEYAITFENVTEENWPDGTLVPTSYMEKTGLASLPEPVKEGYRFDGWYTTEDFADGSQATSIGKEETGDKIFYAKWTDIKVPVLSAKLADGKESGVWYTDAGIELEYQDNHTQNPQIYVRTDGAEEVPLADLQSGGVWSIPEEGIHSYTFCAADEAGNRSDTTTIEVWIDKTAPVFGTVSFEGKTNEDGSWNIGDNTKNAVVTIIEEHSGVSEILYTIEPESGAAQTGTAPVKENRAQIPIAEDFVGVIRINCTDAVGHQAKELVLRAEKDQVESETETEPTISKKEKESAEQSLRRSNTLAVGSGKLTVKWGKVKGADGYEIYAAACGKDMKLVKTVSADKKRSVTIKKIGKKKIKKSEEYKAQVKAYRMVDGEKLYLAEGLTLHAAGPSHSQKTNVSKLKAAKNTYQIKRGKQTKLSIMATKQNRKKTLLSEGHSAQLRYWSTNKKVASVNARGYIRGKNRGTCYIYAMAQNGVVTRVKVKVK